jgi:tetratricopeptide (TPR) repeat protein
MKSSDKFISISLYCIFVIISSVTGQNNNRYIDSLNASLSKFKTDTERINKINQICRDMVWHTSGKLDIIDSLANKALVMAQNNKYRKGIADAYNNLGSAAWNGDDYGTSLDDYILAEKIEEEINYKDGLATSLDGIGEVNNDNQDYSEAFLNFHKALNIYSEVKDTDGVEGVFEDLSECYLNKNFYDSALIFAEKSLKLSEPRKDQYTVINSLADIGEYYAGKNEYDSSMKVFSQMLSIFDTLKDKDNQLMDYYRGIAKGLLKFEKYNEAIENANKSLEIATKIGSIDDIMKSESLVSIIYEQMGSGNLALKHYRIYDSIHSQIFSQNNTRKEQRSELTFEQEKNDAIERQKFHMIIIIFSGIVLGLIIIMISFFKIRKQDRVIQEKDIQLMISRGENEKVEFKSSLIFDVGKRNLPPAIIEHSCLKTIAAFLNSEGGNLIIGVEDNKNIKGLDDTDFPTFKKSETKDHLNPSDEWKIHLGNIIGSRISKAIHTLHRTQFVTFENKTVAIITIKNSREPIWMKNEKGVPVLYIRGPAGTEALQGEEAMKYIKQHYKN